MVNMGELFAHDFLSNQTMELVPMTASEIQRFQLQASDLLFARQSLVLEGTGKCSLFLGASEITTFESHIIRVRLDTARAFPPFYYYYFKSPQGRSAIQSITMQVAASGIRASELAELHVPAPKLRSQRKIAAILSAYDNVIENNSRRIRLLHEMAQKTYREWFIDFRYPGRADAPPLDSQLGPIPEGWSIKAIHEIASAGRYAVTSGPFGSKLGSKDYKADGVPVIRGINLDVGGGFRDADFVFVSEAKANTMPSCIAHVGDVIVTQRGTLGQVGLIPTSARFDRYVISQSQMKITVDLARGCSQYLYAALRSPEVTARLRGQAMTAGVPHINLSILRNFQVVWPSLDLQRGFGNFMGLLGEQVECSRRIIDNARATRDLLLPHLISGEVDVTDRDIAASEMSA